MVEELSGKVLAHRYRIDNLVGEGGMALVYRGEDMLLHRQVAIKVLRPQYAHDPSFVERFQKEAESAARLSHPNVVNVYDVGEENGLHYMVMEFLEGDSLKDVIRAEAPLSPSMAASIAYQIAEALRHAHQHNLVHRDIKPHNILITNDGRVKVTDFGIARAASGSSMTQTGVVLGSVHYFSPEQARGSYIGPQSDIYALGVVLYEMLTGEVPFDGDTPISIALKHLQEEPPSLREKNHGVPEAMERIVLKAMAKDTGRRYASARDLLADLRPFVKNLEDETLLISKVPAAEDERFATRLMTRPVKKMRRTPLGWLFFFTAFVLVGLTIWVTQFVPSFFSVEEVRVPQLSGLPVSEAELLLRSRGLRFQVGDQTYDSTVPPDHIIAQDPLPNRLVKKNRLVRVTLSKGPEMVMVPDVTGQTLREAEISLTGAGLKLGDQQLDYSADVAPGKVIRQDPPALGRVEKGLEVNVVISRGTQTDQVPVPDLVGQAYAKGVDELEQLGLLPGKIIREKRNGLPPGSILDQDPPAAAMVAPGGAVDLVVNEDEHASASKTGLTPLESTGSNRRKAEVRVKVPPGPQQQTIQILLIDDYGAREVYRRNHSPGDEVIRVVEGYGERIKVQIYIDGALYEEANLP